LKNNFRKYLDCKNFITFPNPLKTWLFISLKGLREKIKARAIEHYEKFLNLWKDADPGIAEVEDAKKSEMKKRNNR
jgi:hypothetical protein